MGLDFTLVAEVEELVAGVDEVGRGPLCGAVVTAAVILDPNRPILGLNDSKKLTEARREKLYDEIREKALSWCIARAEVEEIDELNILHATMLAMQRAIEGLHIQPKLAMIDGNRCPKLAMRAEAVVKGDSKVPAIAPQTPSMGPPLRMPKIIATPSAIKTSTVVTLIAANQYSASPKPRTEMALRATISNRNSALHQ